MAKPTKPIRVLQVVHGLVPGGIETWLVNVLRAIDRDRFQIDFVTSAGKPCYYDENVRALGSKIHFVRAPKKPWVYAPELLRTIRRERYDVVHAHLDHYGGFVMRVAQRAGVPTRIAHSHSDTSGKQAQASTLRRMYLWNMKRWIKRSATHGLAVSDKAGGSLFPDWGRDKRWQVLYCGIDTHTFRRERNRAARAQLGIGDDAIVVGHVGGFREPKNHNFLVDVAAAAIRRCPQLRLVLASDGPLRPAIEEKVRRLGLDGKVIFTGYLSDPKEYMRDVFDVFVFPSLWEGLPLAVVEAQAAGIACVISDRITSEVDLVKPLITRCSLDLSADQWAEAVIEAARRGAPTGRNPLAEIETSSFSMCNSVNSLQEIYAAN
jgi:glycosyltransferase involved in cell wall biosynthesis